MGHCFLSFAEGKKMSNAQRTTNKYKSPRVSRSGSDCSTRSHSLKTLPFCLFNSGDQSRNDWRPAACIYILFAQEEEEEERKHQVRKRIALKITSGCQHTSKRYKNDCQHFIWIVEVSSGLLKNGAA